MDSCVNWKVETPGRREGRVSPKSNQERAEKRMAWTHEIGLRTHRVTESRGGPAI